VNVHIGLEPAGDFLAGGPRASISAVICPVMKSTRCSGHVLSHEFSGNALGNSAKGRKIRMLISSAKFEEVGREFVGPCSVVSTSERICGFGRE